MGLDFRAKGYDKSWVGPHWDYSGFHRFRQRLAEEIGVPLLQMEGFRSDGQEGLPWSAVNDPLRPLLNHSDCDGYLRPSQCERVAPRLREIVTRWPEDDYDRQHGLMLVDMMEHCARARTRLVFC